MQENACYSVITPEGCAAILYGERTPERVIWAAEALKITAPDLLTLGVIDGIIPEPPGGAHRYPEAAVAVVGDVLAQHLQEVCMLSPDKLLEQRYVKFRRMGEAAVVAQNSAARQTAAVMRRAMAKLARRFVRGPRRDIVAAPVDDGELVAQAPEPAQCGENHLDP